MSTSASSIPSGTATGCSSTPRRGQPGTSRSPRISLAWRATRSSPSIASPRMKRGRSRHRHRPGRRHAGPAGQDRHRFRHQHGRPVVQVHGPEDGTYRLLLRDQVGSGRKNPSFVYRLMIHAAEPDFRMLAQAIVPGNPQQNQNSRCFRGGPQRRDDGSRRAD